MRSEPLARNRRVAHAEGHDPSRAFATRLHSAPPPAAVHRPRSGSHAMVVNVTTVCRRASARMSARLIIAFLSVGLIHSVLTGVHELDRTSVFTRRARHNGYCLQGVLNGGCVGTRVGARHLHPRVADRVLSSTSRPASRQRRCWSAPGATWSRCWRRRDSRRGRTGRPPRTCCRFAVTCPDRYGVAATKTDSISTRWFGSSTTRSGR